MAQVTTYLLVSGLKENENPETHPIFEKGAFEVAKEFNQKSNSRNAVRFSVQRPIEKSESEEGTATEISKAFPESTVTLCTVEERFGQIEHLRTTVFKDGEYAGEIEHGSVYNVGGR